MVTIDFRWMNMGETLRYAQGADTAIPALDGYPNYHYLTSPHGSGFAKLMLESGINRAKEIEAIDGSRRPVIAIRSSPWKAGHESNPWHDEFDMDHGHVRYFGDHKPGTLGIPGVTVGNRALMEAWPLHSGTSRAERVLAPPLLLFRAVPQVVDGTTRFKGYVEFCGVAVIERLEHVVQRDAESGESFPNIVLDLAVVTADDGDHIDMRWIDDRRNAEVTAEEALRYSPQSWQRWVQEGRSAIPLIRRRVLSSKVKSKAEQMPEPNTPGEQALHEVYRFFDGRKHSFELLAARVAGEVLRGSGATYHAGWLTRAGGDGGVDFVGRLDVGSLGSNTPLVVLGQAKCVIPGSSISPDQVARVVARLRRGWLGVFVTTGVFSRQAQIEVIDDQYPVVLVSGRALAEEVLRMAAASFNGDLRVMLEALVGEYPESVTQRRPEEILQA
ncbi:MAG: hypothetical protein QG597_2748 [Actinomycetota bacterium]|jgi:hypothetical protein|nr:hypothetical protein [Actinomycetota bacterium]